MAAAGREISFELTVYYDSNLNFTPELTEGVEDVGVAIYDNMTNELLAFGYTNEAGTIRFSSLTVTGMIRSFNQIAITEGAARPSQLAGGISEALVTTCMGLVVAIPTMFFVSFFRNRIDGYVAEAETVVEKLMGRFRKATT